MNNVIFQLPYQSTTEYKATDHSSAMTQDDTSMPTVTAVQISLTGKISAKMSTENTSSLPTPILTSLQTESVKEGEMQFTTNTANLSDIVTVSNQSSSIVIFSSTESNSLLVKSHSVHQELSKICSLFISLLCLCNIILSVALIIICKKFRIKVRLYSSVHSIELESMNGNSRAISTSFDSEIGSADT